MKVIPLRFSRTDAEPDPVLVPEDLHNPVCERRELGPKQLAWLGARVPGFRAAKRDADRAIRHADKIKSRVQS